MMDPPKFESEETRNDLDTVKRKPGSKAPGRIRTKSGCLTCRKRRIKCGEERPTCQNCIKSKRHCEGYNQRVVFKDPWSAYRPHPAKVSFPGTSSKSFVAHDGAIPSQKHHGQEKVPVVPKTPMPSISAVDSSDSCTPVERLNKSDDPQDTFTDSTLWHHQTIDHQQLPQTAGVSLSESEPVLHTNDQRVQSIPRRQSIVSVEAVTYNVDNLPVTQPSQSYKSAYEHHPNSDSYHKVDPESTHPTQSEWSISQPWPLDQYQSGVVYDDDDDDPFDVSDEDMEMGENNEAKVWQEVSQNSSSHPYNNNFGALVAVQAQQDSRGLALRSLTSFIDHPNMLATYVPSSRSTPLQDPMAARIFCHFINVTGPIINLYERHPANPSVIFQGGPVPKSQQHIWTYTFPALALQHPALLHAILATASSHIAKLQNGSLTSSYKHYALALRRVAKSVSLPSRRSHPATLAAALLLAFYEVWAADHQKWSNHLLGATQLVREIDFVGMTRYIKRKTKQESQHEHGVGNVYRNFRFQPRSDEIDEDLLGTLMGIKVQHEHDGQILDEDGRSAQDQNNQEYTEREIEMYETQRDLFWWYCKQDMYQSVMGGGRLFMDYASWSRCPPRAPVGRLNAVYGTWDHLVLLMGRLADFTANDLKRKRLANKMNGGRWQPPASMQMPPPNSQQGPLPTAPVAPPEMPAFSGMIPGVKEATLPMGFESSGSEFPPRSFDNDDVDLQTQTREAEQEWQDIRNAFAILESEFGEDFQPLGPDFSTPIPTPFGPALQYRTFAMAGVWMNYYMGLLILFRSHPSMPPAAVMAAGISARETAVFADAISRIAAGIAPDLSMTTEVSPSIGGALIECGTCLFFAGVQVQNTDQRYWIICRLRDIARLTGWESAITIADGCEQIWIKTGEMGLGPKYSRVKDERVVRWDFQYDRIIDRAFHGKTKEEQRFVLERSDRVHTGMGVLSMEGDFENLDLDD